MLKEAKSIEQYSFFNLFSGQVILHSKHAASLPSGVVCDSGIDHSVKSHHHDDFKIPSKKVNSPHVTGTFSIAAPSAP